MQKIRCRNVVFMRSDDAQDWEPLECDSISKAKKENGLNSRTVESAKNLPPKVEPEANPA